MKEPFKSESYRRGFLAGHKEGAEEYRQFVLNTLKGIQIAEREMGEESSIKTIMFAINSRII